MVKILLLILALALPLELGAQTVIIAKHAGAPPGSSYDWASAYKAHYKFESGALTTDTHAVETLTNVGTVVASTTVFKEGAASADFTGSSSQHFYRVDGDLASGFPGKNTGGTQNFLVAGWIRPDGSTMNSVFLSKYYAETNGRSYRIDTVYGTTMNFKILWRSNDDTTTSTKTLTTTDSWPDMAAGWYHFCMWHDSDLNLVGFRVWDDTTSTQYNYSVAHTTGINLSNTPLSIGAIRSSTGYSEGHVDAKMDNVVIYGWADGSTLTEQNIVDKCDSVRGGLTP